MYLSVASGTRPCSCRISSAPLPTCRGRLLLGRTHFEVPPGLLVWTKAPRNSLKLFHRHLG